MTAGVARRAVGQGRAVCAGSASRAGSVAESFTSVSRPSADVWPGASHVGIAIGGSQFTHAPSEKGVVRVENLSGQYWSTRFIGAKRVS